MGPLTRRLLSGSAAVALFAYGANSAQAAKTSLDIPPQPLALALNTVGVETGSEVLFSKDVVAGRNSPPLKGTYEPGEALAALVNGTDLRVQRTADNVFVITPPARRESGLQLAANATVPARSGAIETVTVTAERQRENIQNVPIAVSAFSQKTLTERQIAGGPDLVKEVPNLTFSKTNFTGYNIQIRGIGTQAISVTTDPAVAVAFNGIPFIRNHFFEQEFYDLDSLEVLRGPQGTLWGRNATAGVVNITAAKPTDQFELVGSVDFGNYNNRRLEGMINIPLVDDKLDLRLAGEWTKRDGYSFNAITNQPIDGRDLWSARASLRWRPTADLDINLVWERFSEDDDRMRTAKQLCHTALPPTSVNGVPVPAGNLSTDSAALLGSDNLSQGCQLTSLYSPDAFQVPYGFSLPYAVALGIAGNANPGLNPYASTVQSQNLRVIESQINPHYRAKNDTIELNADYQLTPELTFTSQTGYNQDFLSSNEDYNRFNTSPGIFKLQLANNFPPHFFPDPAAGTGGVPASSVIYCDPQLGCSDRLVAEDLSNEHAWQLSQEFRLASNFSGPFNFSAGGNYLHYETEENYYVFINALTIFSRTFAGNGEDNSSCLPKLQNQGDQNGWQYTNPIVGGGTPTSTCIFVDTNPITNLNNNGHNYFLSQNPYTLNSYATFGEAYYQITPEIKLTGGLRWTEDRKHFVDIPSQVLTRGSGYPITAIVDQQWNELTGRSVVNWTPKLDFTDQTLVYLSYARGYKAGGANPPGAVLNTGNPFATVINEPIHPLTFRPEFVNAYELGSKNSLFDGALTLNTDVFYYAYKDYQISEIVDRTSINLNFNATVKGAEIETTWEPAPGLKFSFAGGYEDATLNKGDSAVDLMDRTAGMPGWMVVKPYVSQASNCILPTYVVQAILQEGTRNLPGQDPLTGSSLACSVAYVEHLDPATLEPYVANPVGLGGVGYGASHGSPNTPTFPIPAGYIGFDPTNAAINNGAGFAKNLSGNQLPNAPHFTASFTAEYTMPVWTNWAATLHGDLYWQANSMARVFNDKPYDQIHGYTNLNLALILNSADGWQVMGYVKNVFNVTAITGDFLNSDDSGLTTNVFLTDPQLFGVRVTKDFTAGEAGSYGIPEFFQDIFTGNDKPSLWIELGGQMENISGQGAAFAPAFLAANPTSPVLWSGTTPLQAQKPSTFSFGEEANISFQPEGSDWIVSAAVRFGRSGNFRHVHHQTNRAFISTFPSSAGGTFHTHTTIEKFADTQVHHKESHTVLDFMAGKDLGLGMFGLEGSSVLSGGVRIAQFSNDATFDIRARPDLQLKYYPSANATPRLPFAYFHTYHATGHASRNFHGIGPSLSWKGSTPVAGDLQDGEATFDWGINAAVLFGKQNTHVRHHESGNVFHAPNYKYYAPVYAPRAGGHDTNRFVTVPNLGGFAGASYKIKNAKISFGYRADFFFGALDGGIDARKSQTLGFTGPFAKISIGFGD